MNNQAWVFFLAGASLFLTAVAILPGSLGILKFTHKLAAHPRGAFFTYVLCVPIYGLSVVLVVATLVVAWRGPQAWPVTWLLTPAFAGLSVFGFLMNTRFMFRPVRHPKYITLEEAIARFGEEEEVIGVVDRNGQPFAYVARLARRPHIVYQTQGESPFLMSHCILSHSSMAYAINEKFSPERIFISSVLANNLVFYDRANGCSVTQIRNRPLGTGQSFDCLPTVMTSLGSWKKLHPDSRVWVRAREWRDVFYLKLLARASVIDPRSPDLVYPLARPVDHRLPLKAFVMGVHIEGETKAYPLDLFATHPVVEDTLGGKPLVFFSSGGGDMVQLFSRRLDDGRALSFHAAPAGEEFHDHETGSDWGLDGSCRSGTFKGCRLTPIPHYNKIFWCVWADFFPATVLAEIDPLPVVMR